ncbi:uncharacterized protein LOC131666051 [Phymastichus coffea]|uniref:uncharacterized protein LOC131666051 n=1 Tax=Phymastichus coffea TaxID=108790 RepID=UPI00273A9B4D|nr:uncharacterized protein LOC131666051 [Phymastichus coffea]
MCKNIFYLFIVYLTVTNVQSDAIFSTLKNKPIISTIEDNELVAGLKDKLTNNSILEFVSNNVTLNCFGLPVRLFDQIFEKIFTQTTTAEDVRFYFYSRNRVIPVTVLAKSRYFDLSDINFSTKRQTIIISHGFMSSGKEEWIRNMTRAFLQLDDFNVIVVDWQKGSNTWNYFEASVSTRLVGSEIANLLYKIKRKGLDTNALSKSFGKLYFVGHSLGAHICAHASYKIQQLEKDDAVKWTVFRITGLDPAQPCFKTADPSLRLDKDDAEYVDVIHSNGRQLIFLGLGLPGQLGNDDFYPNGGQTQIGCDNINATFWQSLMVPVNIIKTTICSHGRSHEFFTDSIEVKLSGVCTYRGHKWNQKYENIRSLLKEKCNDFCPEMGINAINYRKQNKDEIYFVPTGDKPNFCEITKEDIAAIGKQLRKDHFMNYPMQISGETVRSEQSSVIVLSKMLFKKGMILSTLLLNIFLIESQGLEIPKVAPSDSIKSKIKNPFGSVKNISKTIQPNIPDPLDAFNKISEQIPDPLAGVKNITELITTTAVFIKNNVSLNCFGLPIAAFANVVEKIFTQSTKAEDVRFYIATPTNHTLTTVRVDNFTLQNTNFDIRRPTVVISHGFMATGRDDWLTEMKDAFLKLDDLNVVLVDWQKGSNVWNYYSAAISTRIVGLQIAKLFAKIRGLAQASPNTPGIKEWGSLYFIGHSLGSHICAHAAYLIAESQKNNSDRWLVTRITGLDPAQPCFSEADLKLRLDQHDAPFVDVIHTNARHILFLGLGLPEKLGFADFYPNGGQTQPGCGKIDPSVWEFLLLPSDIIKETICSHGRSHDYLIESLVDHAAGNCTFVGFKWDKQSKEVVKFSKEKCSNGFCTEMGINAAEHYPQNAGVFFVPTREEAPFCGAHNEQEVFKVYSSKNPLARLAKKIIPLGNP